MSWCLFHSLVREILLYKWGKMIMKGISTMSLSIVSWQMSYWNVIPLQRCDNTSVEVGHRIIESYNQNSSGSKVPVPLLWAGTPSSTRPALPKLDLNTSSQGPSTNSQCLTTIMVKHFLIIVNLNLPSFSVKPPPFVLSLHALVKSTSPAFLWAHFKHWRAVTRSTHSILFSRLTNYTLQYRFNRLQNCPPSKSTNQSETWGPIITSYSFLSVLNFH